MKIKPTLCKNITKISFRCVFSNIYCSISSYIAIEILNEYAKKTKAFEYIFDWKHRIYISLEQCVWEIFFWVLYCLIFSFVDKTNWASKQSHFETSCYQAAIPRVGLNDPLVFEVYTAMHFLYLINFISKTSKLNDAFTL